MGAAVCPPHLLFLHHAFAHDLVDGGLDEACGDGLSMPVAIPVVRDEFSVGSYVSPEFSHRFQQFSLFLIIFFEVQSDFQIFHNLYRLVSIPMLKIPFEAFEFFFYFSAQIRLIISLDAFG